MGRRGRAARPAGAPAMRKLGHEGQSTYSTERESAFRFLCVETHSLCRNEYILRPAVAAVKRSGVLGCRNENFACESVRCPRCRNENFACETQTRTLSGPPSTGASIAMDGGVADTPCYYTGRLVGGGRGCCCCSTQRAWSPDPQARGTLSLWTGAWPTQPAITHYM